MQNMDAIVLKDIADRYGRIDSQIRNGKLDLSYSIGHYAWQKDLDHLSLVNLGAAEPSLSDPNTHSIPFTISTYDEDRDGDLVRPLGVHTRNYQRNPIIFFGHQEWVIPIAKAMDNQGRLRVECEENRVRSIAFFDEHDDDAMLIYDKCCRGFLNAASIAFVPVKAHRREYMEKAETRNHPQMPLGWYFEEVDLTEWSVVGVPANSGAIADIMDKEKSFMSPRLQKAMKPYAAVAKGNCFTGWCPPCGCEKKILVDNGGSMNKPKALQKDVGTLYSSTNLPKDQWLAAVDEILQSTKGKDHTGFPNADIDKIFASKANPRQAAVAIVSADRGQTAYSKKLVKLAGNPDAMRSVQELAPLIGTDTHALHDKITSLVQSLGLTNGESWTRRAMAAVGIGQLKDVIQAMYAAAGKAAKTIARPHSSAYIANKLKVKTMAAKKGSGHVEYDQLRNLPRDRLASMYRDATAKPGAEDTSGIDTSRLSKEQLIQGILQASKAMKKKQCCDKCKQGKPCCNHKAVKADDFPAGAVIRGKTKFPERAIVEGTVVGPNMGGYQVTITRVVMRTNPNTAGLEVGSLATILPSQGDITRVKALRNHKSVKKGLKVGDKVVVQGFKTVGKIISIDGDQAYIDLGVQREYQPLTALRQVSADQKVGAYAKAATQADSEISGNDGRDINSRNKAGGSFEIGDMVRINSNPPVNNYVGRTGKVTNASLANQSAVSFGDGMKAHVFNNAQLDPVGKSYKSYFAKDITVQISNAKRGALFAEMNKWNRGHPGDTVKIDEQISTPDGGYSVTFSGSVAGEQYMAQQARVLKSLKRKAAEPSSDIDSAKACKILEDGTINGEPLTEAQRGMFGAACGRNKGLWKPVVQKGKKFSQCYRTVGVEQLAKGVKGYLIENAAEDSAYGKIKHACIIIDASGKVLEVKSLQGSPVAVKKAFGFTSKMKSIAHSRMKSGVSRDYESAVNSMRAAGWNGSNNSVSSVKDPEVLARFAAAIQGRMNGPERGEAGTTRILNSLLDAVKRQARRVGRTPARPDARSGSSESYFSSCDRDDQGHCKALNESSGMAGGYIVPPDPNAEDEEDMKKKKTTPKAKTPAKGKSRVVRKVRDEDVTGDEDDSASGPQETPEESESPKEQASLPPGAKRLALLHQHLKAADDWLESEKPNHEPEANEHIEKWHQHVKDGVEGVANDFSERYPEQKMEDVLGGTTEPEGEIPGEEEEKDDLVDSGGEDSAVDEGEVPEEDEEAEADAEASDEAPGEEEMEEDEDVPDGSSTDELLDRYRKPKSNGRVVTKGLANGHFEVVRDAGQHMYDLAGAPDLPSYHKAGLMHHSNELGKLCKDMEDGDMPDEDVKDEMPTEDDNMTMKAEAPEDMVDDEAERDARMESEKAAKVKKTLVPAKIENKMMDIANRFNRLLGMTHTN